jgi:hypothetical protein
MPSQKLFDQVFEKAINCTGRSQNLQVEDCTYKSSLYDTILG